MQQEPRQVTWLHELARTILPALFIVMFLNLFVAQATRVDGNSMDPTLVDAERVIIEKLSYRFALPDRGDIVVLVRPDGRDDPPLIKRVIALPGETIEVSAGKVVIDGRPLDEPYLVQNTAGAMPSTLVPEGHVFVMGDNRSHSNDSRSFGVVSDRDILGRAWLAYWPVSAWRIF